MSEWDKLKDQITEAVTFSEFGKAVIVLAEEHGLLPVVEKIKIVKRRPRRTREQIAVGQLGTGEPTVE